MRVICLGCKRSKWEIQEYFSWGRKVKMHKSFKELTSGDELYSLAKEFLEKHVAECCWKETQDKGENKVAYCSPKGCPEFKLSAN